MKKFFDDLVITGNDEMVNTLANSFDKKPTYKMDNI